jgi:hypothetical protein
VCFVRVGTLDDVPMMLLTNLPPRKNRKVLWWVVCAYLTRWRVEVASIPQRVRHCRREPKWLP